MKFPTDLSYPYKIDDLLAFGGEKRDNFQNDDAVLTLQFNNTTDEIDLATNGGLGPGPDWSGVKSKYPDAKDWQKKLVFRAFAKLFIFNCRYNENYLPHGTSLSTGQGAISQSQTFLADRNPLLEQVYHLLKHAGFYNGTNLLLTTPPPKNTFGRVNLVRTGSLQTYLTYNQALKHWVRGDNFKSSDDSISVSFDNSTWQGILDLKAKTGKHTGDALDNTLKTYKKDDKTYLGVNLDNETLEVLEQTDTTKKLVAKGLFLKNKSNIDGDTIQTELTTNTNNITTHYKKIITNEANIAANKKNLLKRLQRSDLKAGANITLTPGTNNEVTIAASGGGPSFPERIHFENKDDQIDGVVSVSKHIITKADGTKSVVRQGIFTLDYGPKKDASGQSIPPKNYLKLIGNHDSKRVEFWIPVSYKLRLQAETITFADAHTFELDYTPIQSFTIKHNGSFIKGNQFVYSLNDKTGKNHIFKQSEVMMNPTLQFGDRNEEVSIAKFDSFGDLDISQCGYMFGKYAGSGIEVGDKEFLFIDLNFFPTKTGVSLKDDLQNATSVSFILVGEDDRAAAGKNILWISHWNLTNDWSTWFNTDPTPALTKLDDDFANKKGPQTIYEQHWMTYWKLRNLSEIRIGMYDFTNVGITPPDDPSVNFGKTFSKPSRLIIRYSRTEPKWQNY